ncbi:MAG: cupin domain-containing protein [Solirubrobacterales bacterium]
MPNIFDPQWDQRREMAGFTQDRALIGRQAGAQKLGASVWEMKPGDAAYPYHFHYAEEEMVIVLSGTPSLRTPAGWRELATGEVVSFLTGPDGAHQLLNRSDEVVRILSLSTMADAEVVHYPDSGKVGAYGNRGKPDETRETYLRSTVVDYWDGEQPPEPPPSS